MSQHADKDIHFMQMAYDQAQIGLKEGGIPIGAVLVLDNVVLSRGHNKRIQENSMIKHGETDCIENTARTVSASDMQRATLYTTLSPCYMCAGTILLNKIPRVVIGENTNFQQSESWLSTMGVEMTVLDDQDCIQMMSTFIQMHPSLWAEDIGVVKE